MPVASDRSILKSFVKHIQEKDVDPFTPLIDAYLTKRELPKYRDRRLKEFSFPVLERPRPLGRLSPSALCGCERQAAFKMLGVEGRKRVDADTELVFMDGHWRHHKWDYIFLDMQAMFPNKIKVLSYEDNIKIPHLFIAGSLDIHVAVKMDGRWVRYVIDFKGANDWAFQYVHKNHAPKPEHLLQVLPYMRAKKCRKGAVIYDSKNRNNFYIFTFDFNAKEWKMVRRWAGRVLDQLERNVLPPTSPDCTKGNFMGDKCPFRGLCYGPKDDDRIEQEIFQQWQGLEALWEEGLAIEAEIF
jgi:hypothetical protein